MAALPIGKIDPDLLAEVLAWLPSDPSVIVGAGVGSDAAVMALDAGRYLVAKSDPITFAADALAAHAIAVNANDIAVTGGEPRYFLATVLCAPGTTAAQLRALFRELAAVAAQRGVSVVGGHTEVVEGLPRTIVAGHMLGFVAPERMIRSDGARAGDALVLVRPVAVEGTAIMARTAPAACRAAVGAAACARAASLLDDPGIDVEPLVRAVRSAVVPHACHDPTDGGVMAAVRELAHAAGLGVVLDADAVPVLSVCRRLCQTFGLDPLRLIASGSLLCAVDAAHAGQVVAAARRAGEHAAVIGAFVPCEEGMRVSRSGVQHPFPQDVVDAIVAFHLRARQGGEG